MAGHSADGRSWHVCAEKIQFAYSEELSASDKRWLMCNANMQSGTQALNSFYFNHLLGVSLVLIEFLNHDLSVH